MRGSKGERGPRERKMGRGEGQKREYLLLVNEEQIQCKQSGTGPWGPASCTDVWTLLCAPTGTNLKVSSGLSSGGPPLLSWNFNWESLLLFLEIHGFWLLYATAKWYSSHGFIGKSPTLGTSKSRWSSQVCLYCSLTWDKWIHSWVLLSLSVKHDSRV